MLFRSLDYTYGVQRVMDEPLSSTIGRTPTYQKMSVPQSRYVEEDIPTGLVPLEALAKRFEIDHSAITYVLDLYDNRFNKDCRSEGRNLDGFSTEYLENYLIGIREKGQLICPEFSNEDMVNMSGI